MTKHILIVEDDAVSFMIAKTLFSALDCTVDHADSGEKAIELVAMSMVKEKLYHGIYMDIGLPGITGIKTCQEIRDYEQQSKLSPIPIIAVTANNALDVQEECMAAGMTAVYYKPLTPQKVTEFLLYCD